MLAEYFAIGFGALSLCLLGCLYITIVAGSKIEDERNSMVMQIRRQDQEITKLAASEQLAQNRLKEAEKKAQLAIADAQQRIEESRSMPLIACFTDYQVSNLAVALGTFIREILLGKKDYIN